jgi:hypothetical protein
MTTADRPTYTVRTPEDLLALVPVVLGFVPHESVTLVTFSGPAGSGPFHARIDLPHAELGTDAYDDELDDLVEALVAPVLMHGAGRVAVLVHARSRMEAAIVSRALLTALADQAPEVEVVEALHADGVRWRPLLPGRPAWAYRGVEYDVSAHPLLAQSVLDGRVTHGSREELAATLMPDDDGVRAVEAAAADRATVPVDSDSGVAERAWARATVLAAVREGRRLDDEDAARLLLGMLDPLVRDAAWAPMTRAAAREHVELWRDLVQRSPRALRAAPAALLGFAAWLHGDGALAWCAVERCREVAPGYGLAAHVATVLEGAVPPRVWDEHDGRPFGADAG